MAVGLIYILLVICCCSTSILSVQHTWFWTCDPYQICKKEVISKTDLQMKNVKAENLMNLDTCQLVCMDDFGLWPLPNKINRHNSLDFEFVNGCRIRISVGLPEHFHQGFMRFYDNVKLKVKMNGLSNYCLDDDSTKLIPNTSTSPSYPVNLVVNVKDPSYNDLILDTDESYHLSIEKKDNEIMVNITSENYFGFRLALETLDQLIVLNDINDKLIMPTNVDIEDSPKYPYRGVMLDSARNFLSVNAIKRTIEAMAINKLNTLHWHLTDTQSFPFYSKSVPDLSLYGAYSPSRIYSEKDIENVVTYAKIRGIRIIPELDAPAHVGEGWEKMENLVVCFNKEPWTKYCVEPPCGQFNPIEENLYKTLEKVYRDVFEGFRQPILFHMGGDEVNNACWNSIDEITNWMKKKKWNNDKVGFLKLWNYFQERAFQTFQNVSNRTDVILWTSELTKLDNVEQYIPKERYIIQIWDRTNNREIAEYLKKGYRVILSNYNKLYLDCGFGGWVNDGNNWCSPYIEWQKFYNHLTNEDETEIYRNLNRSVVRNLILGSEATLWTEQADDATVDSRLWPRSAALAESLWTKRKLKWKNVEKRLLIQRTRLILKGIQADALKPQWCLQNKQKCVI